MSVICSRVAIAPRYQIHVKWKPAVLARKIAGTAAIRIRSVEVASGGQTDRVMPDVERFIGGSGADGFGIDNRAEIEESDYPLPDLVLEGLGLTAAHDAAAERTV